jgi:cell division protein FtsA
MGKRNENIITVIDVGSSKTVALAVEITEQGLRYRGHGVAESRGSRKGVIVDLEKAVLSVQKAVEEAERTAELPLESAVVGISGPHLRALNSQGGISLGARAREISREDMRLAVEKARSIPLPEDRQVLHLLPQEFILDDQSGIRDPFGMMGRQLEVRVHVITASNSATQNIITVLNRAGMEVTDTVYEALAASDAVLRSDEREVGAVVIDIGAGSSDMIVVQEGVVTHSAVVPIGGDHFTSDVAVGLRTPLAEAENIKRQFGHCVYTSVPDGNEIEVPSVGDRPPRMARQRELADYLEARARELAEMARDNLRAAGLYQPSDLKTLPGGVIVTGGGARLQGVLETMEETLRRPTRMGMPLGMAKLPAFLAEPEFSVALGLVFYSHRSRVLKGKEDGSITAKLKAMFAKSNFGLA